MANFSVEEREILLGVKFVGPTVIRRLEEIGYSKLHELATADVDAILDYTGANISQCWKNSPQARAAIRGAIECALEQNPDKHPNTL